jgi:DNA polymerase-3 subunit delta
VAEFVEIIKEIREGRFSPVYFLQGEEPFFIDNISDHIEVNALEESQKGFNQYVLYGKEITLPEILGTARKYPMMGERQVVIVKEAQELKGWTAETNQELLINYLENPLPTTILVFAYKYKRLDKRTKLSKMLVKNAVFLDSKKIYDNQVPQWIASYAAARNAVISQKAIMLLSEQIGNNLQRLSNEIDKLLLNVKEGQEIDDKAVHRYVGISKDYNVFELQQSIAVRNLKKAMRIVDYFGANPNKHPLVLTLGSLFSYFTKLLLMHHHKGLNENDLAREVGVPVFFIKEYQNAVRQFPLPKVQNAIHLIHEADLRSKGIGYNLTKEREKGLLRELVYQIIA